jgi:dihydrofolate reductase
MIRMIFAASSNGIIGRDGLLPWYLPDDLVRFRQLTAESVVVMGRRTWESLPTTVRPLVGRTNVVLTRSSGPIEGCITAHSVEQVLEYYPDSDVWFIGGTAVLQDAMTYVDEIYVTEVHIDIRDGDAMAPSIDVQTFEIISESDILGAPGLQYRYIKYQRR